MAARHGDRSSNFDPLGFLFNLVGLWFVGAFIERTQGTRRFLTLFFAAGILGNVAIGPRPRPCSGRAASTRDARLAVLALFVAFARIFDRQEATVVLGASASGRTTSR